MTSAYDIRQFRPGSAADGAADDATTGWISATTLGFHSAELTQEHMGKMAAVYAENDWTLTGAYAESAPKGAWPVTHPVATYASFRRNLNVGGNQVLAHLIAGVTVRANHRRRGLLRTIIEADLRTAASDGVAIAALYAAEASIYGRFGFGPATETRKVHLNTGAGFRLDHTATGSVDVADRESLARVAPDVFDRYHAQTLGSIERQTFSAGSIAGLWSDWNPEPDPKVRSLLHYGADGDIDGYVAYKAKSWDVVPPTLSVIEFIALTRDAWAELWQHLASIDLIQRIEVENAPLADPLAWTLDDPRRYKVVGGEDGVWLRILDVVAALTARSYETDGEITVQVTDPQGIASGRYRLAVRGGKPDVTTTTTAPEITLDISALSSLYLGGPSAITLARAGRVAGSPDAVATLTHLLRHDIEPYCATHF
ncbi:MAG TPA: GNAT family N-acetyltransferase [Galbitalea sp.]|jgi:predicted acetyltransferase